MGVSLDAAIDPVDSLFAGLIHTSGVRPDLNLNLSTARLIHLATGLT